MENNLSESQRYTKAIHEVLELRKERSDIYGDTWSELGFEGNAWHIVNKAGRLRWILKNGVNNYESKKDTLLDIVNYALFAICELDKIGEK